MAQNHMKQQAYQHWSEREFVVGDLIFLQLQPYRQSFTASRSLMKSMPHFYGPFKVIQRVGPAA